MAYAFNEDRSKVDVYTEDEIDAMDFVTADQIDAMDLVKGFDTVADMQTATLEAGNICHTNGFHTAGDGGAAFYKITASGTANGMDVLACGDVFANLVITENYVTPEMFGAYGDGVHDDIGSITTMFSSGSNDFKFSIDKNYLLTDRIVILNPCNVYGGNFVFDDEFNGESVFFITNNPSCVTFENINMSYIGTNSFADVHGVMINHVQKAVIDNVRAYKLRYVIHKTARSTLSDESYMSDEISINNLYCDACRCAVHNGDCKKTHISNVVYKNPPVTTLLSSAFYIRPNSNIDCCNIEVENSDGSVFHCNREVFEVTVPEYDENAMLPIYINASNINANGCRRIIDVNTYVNALIENVRFHGNYANGSGFVEMLHGSGNVTITNAICDNLYEIIVFSSINQDIPNAYKNREINIVNSDLSTGGIIKCDSGATGGIITLSNNHIKASDAPAAAFYDMEKLSVYNNLIESIGYNAVVFQSYTTGAVIICVDNVHIANTYNAFVRLTGTSENNIVKCNFNTGKSSNIVSDAGTNNTVTTNSNVDY